MRVQAVLACLAAAIALCDPALAQIPWGTDLEKGLAEARDRDAPIFALLWDYN